MVRIIADTSFLIDLMKKDERALKKLASIEQASESQYTTSPTVFELATGISISQWHEKEKRKVKSVLMGFAILNFNSNHAFISGKILGELFNLGNPIDPIDAQIAGIAICENQKIVTRNVKHFERIPSLIYESY